MIGYKELSERWGISKNKLYVMKSRGQLPPFDIDQGTHPARVVGWYEDTITRLEKHGVPGKGGG